MTIFFLTNPLKTLPLFCDLLLAFGKISRYRISYEKSNLMGINVSDSLKTAVQQICRARWENDFVRYVGINISVDFSNLISNNFTRLMHSTKNILAHWVKLKLSWMGRIATIKMVILPCFLFLFQNLLIDLPNVLFGQIQRLINKFIWSVKKPRIKFSVTARNG